jgi:hypothetical protein
MLGVLLTHFAIRKSDLNRRGSYMSKDVLALFAIGIYIILPTIMIWGWARWSKHKQPRTILSTLSLIGFALGTISGLLAISGMIYARLAGGLPFYDPVLLRIYRWGAVVSLAGMIFGIAGIWRPGPLRWHAPVCALATLIFWLAAAVGE